MGKKYNDRKASKSESQGSQKSDSRDSRGGKYDNRKTKENSSRSDSKSAAGGARTTSIPSQLQNDAGSLSFNNPLGATIEGVVDTVDYRIPGFAALHYVPTIGRAENTSAVNMASQQLMANLRSTVSTNLPFTAPDLMMYLVAMDGMYSFYSHCVRLYGLYRAYSGMNRYYPKLIMEALEIKINSSSDWNKFRMWINIFAAKASQLYAPAVFSFFARHMWMNANVYLDAPDAKAQSYMFVQDYVYQWDDTSDPAGTRLQLTAMPHGPSTTLEDVMAFGDVLLENLVITSSVANISGIIYRAFGPEGCITLPSLTEDWAINPVYNEDVLAQIHNATICGSPIIDDTYGNITQNQWDKVVVKYRTFCETNESLAHLPKNKLLNTDFATGATVDEVFNMSRLTVSGTVVAGSDTLLADLNQYGTEFITHVRIHVFGDWVPVRSSCVTTTQVTPIIVFSGVSAFRKFPLLFTAVKAGVDGQTKDVISGVFGDMNNYTVIASPDLAKLHDAATLAAFSVNSSSFGSKR